MLRFQCPTNLSHIALALGSSPNNFCEMMYPWCWFGSESSAIGDSWGITRRDPWVVSNSITRAFIISQSNPLFQLIWYFFLHTVLCILKNKTSWIRSPLMTKWCLQKERSNKRKTRHHSQNTNGPMPPLRWAEPVVAVELSSSKVLTGVGQESPSSSAVKEPPPHPCHHPTPKKPEKTAVGKHRSRSPVGVEKTILGWQSLLNLYSDPHVIFAQKSLDLKSVQWLL